MINSNRKVDNNMKYEMLIEKAMNMLENDDDLFLNCVIGLDQWDGFCEDDRIYPMEALNDWCFGMPAVELLSKLTSDFDINDDFFMWTIYGLESYSGNEVDFYRDRFDCGNVLDEMLQKGSHVYTCNSEFDDLLDEINSYNKD